MWSCQCHPVESNENFGWLWWMTNFKSLFNISTCRIPWLYCTIQCTLTKYWLLLLEYTVLYSSVMTAYTLLQKCRPYIQFENLTVVVDIALSPSSFWICLLLSCHSQSRRLTLRERIWFRLNWWSLLIRWYRFLITTRTRRIWLCIWIGLPIKLKLKLKLKRYVYL